MNDPKKPHLSFPDAGRASVGVRAADVAAEQSPLAFEGLVLDAEARTLIGADGTEIVLRRSEFELLLAFVSNPGRALTRDTLLEAAAGRRCEPFDRSIDVLVSRLRRKIEPDPARPRLIVTVPGVGYRFTAKLRRVPGAGGADPGWRGTIDRASILVLPFSTVNNDAEAADFACGLAEDILIALSRVGAVIVVAATSSADARGATYVLAGSVRRNGDRVRVSAQLIQASTACNVWAERYDRYLSDVFAVQDEVGHAIARAAEQAIEQSERQRALSLGAPRLVGVSG